MNSLCAVHLHQPKRRRIALSESISSESAYSTSSTPSSINYSYSSHHSSPASSPSYTSSVHLVSDLPLALLSNSQLETSAPSDSPLPLDNINTLTPIQSSIPSTKSHFISIQEPLDSRQQDCNIASPRLKSPSANHWIDPYCHHQDLDNSAIRSHLTYPGRKRKRDHGSKEYGHRPSAMQPDASATANHNIPSATVQGRPSGSPSTAPTSKSIIDHVDQIGPRKRLKLDHQDAVTWDATPSKKLRNHSYTGNHQLVPSSYLTRQARLEKQHGRPNMSLRSSKTSVSSPSASKSLATSRYEPPLELGSCSPDAKDEMKGSILEDVLHSIHSDATISPPPSATYQASDCSTPRFEQHSASDSPASSTEANTPTPYSYQLDSVSTLEPEQDHGINFRGIYTR
jgi:hypothetical protein